MQQNKSRSLSFVLCLIAGFASAGVSATAQAKVQVEITGRITGEHFNLGIGSKVKLDFGHSRAKAEGLFLGRVVESDGHSDEFLFLDLQKTRAYLIDRTNTEFNATPSKPQIVLRPMDQAGNTCAAYAMTHFWQQYSFAGFRGNENLDAMMASERSRTKFLEENINHYYMSRPVELQTIMKQYGKRFGVTCRSKYFGSGSAAADFLYRQTLAGNPVMMDYNIGPYMLTSSYETVDFEKPGTIDSRLWVPRQVGQRNSGGHAIVAAAAFVSHGHRKVLVIDSDWDQVRIWDIDRYLSEKVAIKEMGFTTCGQLQ